MVSDEYFYHMKGGKPLSATRNTEVQEQLPDFCLRVTGVEPPS
jgi:hypothetical protein